MSVAREELKRVTFMRVAELIGELSTCPRKAVGAVIVRDGRAISWGYNGAPPGMQHCVHLDDEPCETATHAEANAIAFAAAQGISTEGATLYVTVSPCLACSRLLIAAGISEVVAQERYRDESGLFLLTDAGVEVHELQ